MTAGIDLGDLVRPALLGPLIADTTADPRWLGLTARLIAGGKSNLTFELSSPAGRLILRRPPTGQLLPSAHDMGREARVQRALACTDVPVAEIVVEDRTSELIGAPFYVMTKVEGHVIRGDLPPSYADAPGQRTAIGDALVDVLAGLHLVEPNRVGLGDFGRPEGFLARQVRRWQGQWAASKTVDVPVLDALGERLTAGLPASPPPTVVHGDFRLDNCLMHPTDPGTVAAVLDWELATVGDPLTDLAMLLFYWREPGERQTTLTPTATTLPGFPTRAHLVERYAVATGRDVDRIGYYQAFAHFKFAVIAQGIAARVAAGTMAGQDFGDLDDEIVRAADAGLSILNGQN